MSFDRLIEKIVEKQNPTVAGLDPKLDYVPQSIKSACFEKYGKTLEGAAAALLEFQQGYYRRNLRHRAGNQAPGGLLRDVRLAGR